MILIHLQVETGKEIAWNVIQISRFRGPAQKRIRKETEILGKINHKYIMKFFSVWETVTNDRPELHFVTERAASTLRTTVSRLHPLSKKQIQRWCRQILTALSYLHGLTPPIIHRDLKSENIFLNGSSGDIRIGDFGLSTQSDSSKTLLGSPAYMAPELFAGKQTVNIFPLLSLIYTQTYIRAKCRDSRLNFCYRHLLVL